jgi:magnesium transporter
MVMLSDLLRYRVEDVHGVTGRLSDLAVDLAAGDYPTVTRLFYTVRGKGQRILEWRAMQPTGEPHVAGPVPCALDQRRRVLRVTGLAAGVPAPEEAPGDEVRLKRDVMDALILELQSRRAARANDLWLEETDGHLALCAVDTSSRAFLRRVSAGRWGHIQTSALYDWKYVEFLRGDPTAAHLAGDYHQRIARLPPGEIARLSIALPYLHATELLTRLPDTVAADVLEAMPPERQLQVFEELPEGRVVGLLPLMRPDVVADLLGVVDPTVAQFYLEKLPDEPRDRVLALLRYPDDTAGGIMTNDLVIAPGDWTVREAMQALHRRLGEPDFVDFIYVVDDARVQHLRGMINLRDFLAADPGSRLEEIMNPYILTLQPLEPATDAAYRVLASEMPALPVTDREGRLRGAVALDSALVRVAPLTVRREVPRVFS